jgi:hypothetical protein
LVVLHKLDVAGLLFGAQKSIRMPKILLQKLQKMQPDRKRTGKKCLSRENRDSGKKIPLLNWI